MAVPTFTITCTQKKLIAPGVYEIRFTKPEGFLFKAGQFVLFDVPLVADPANIQQRAYSIASTPAEPDLLFCIKLVDGGRASTWIVEQLKIGTQVMMKGPFGVFVLQPEKTPKNYLFICTGAGVAPFRGQIRHALEAGETRKMDLIFGARTSADLFWVKEFTELSEQYPNFFFHASLTSGEPDWHGHRGRVQVMAPQVIGGREQNTCVYICGAPDMVKDVKTHCIEQWGIPKADVHAEGYM
ncbi:MAG TPA: FAD-dependent oxidoreductase [Candidatus Peribacteria bacterium]|nr:FAD-dependent oxidoreductase [Candidatus Peribacteria bacterium]